MISYNAVYASGSRPYLAKTVLVSGESYETKLVATMPNEELDLVPLSVIYSHMDNLVLYIQELSLNLQVLRIDDPLINFSESISGYKKIESVYEESIGWFQYIYKNRDNEDEESPA